MAETTRTTSESTARGGAARDSAASVEGALAEAKNLGSDLMATARDSAGGIIDEQRRRAADEIKSFGEALRQSAKSFEDASGFNVARYADDAARQIGDFAETVRSRSWRDLGGDVEDFARRWPFAFMAAAIGIGFIGGRFLLSAQSGTGTTAGTGSGMNAPTGIGTAGTGTAGTTGMGTTGTASPVIRTGSPSSSISPGSAAASTPPATGFGGGGPGREKT